MRASTLKSCLYEILVTKKGKCQKGMNGGSSAYVNSLVELNQII